MDDHCFLDLSILSVCSAFWALSNEILTIMKQSSSRTQLEFNRIVLSWVLSSCTCLHRLAILFSTRQHYQFVALFVLYRMGCFLKLVEDIFYAILDIVFLHTYVIHLMIVAMVLIHEMLSEPFNFHVERISTLSLIVLWMILVCSKRKRKWATFASSCAPLLSRF